MSTKALQDPALQEYYESLFEMYGSPGWRKLMEDIGHAVEMNDKLAGIETEAGLWFRKGELSQMTWLQNHQAMTEGAYKLLLEEQEGDDVVIDESTGGRAKVVA